MPTPKSALGTVGEDRFFEALLVLGRGDFVCYPPRSDMEGIDFLVKRRWKAGSVAVQVKTRDYRDPHGTIPVAIDQQDLPADDPKLIVVLDYDEALARLREFCWVIPDDVYRDAATLTHGNYDILLSPKRNSRDRFVDYRYNVGDLPWVIGTYIDRAAAPRRAFTRGSPPRPGPRPAAAKAASRPRRRRR